MGSAVLAKAIADLKQQKIARFWCDARTTAIGFYEKFGLSQDGPVFYKHGVAYSRMHVQWDS